MDADSRIEAYQELFHAAHLANQSWDAYLRPDLEQARYRLGTSVADRIIPYVLEKNVQTVFSRAFLELAYLYVARNRPALGEETYDSFLLNVGQTTVPLRPVAFQAPQGVQNQTVRRAMFLAPRILTGLDSGVMASWWGSGGKGRELLVAWAQLLARAVNEMAASCSKESTPYLLHWALLQAFGEAGNVLLPYQLAEPARRELQAAMLLGAHLSHQVVWSQTLSNPKLEHLIEDTLRVQWNAVLNPRVSFSPAPKALERCRFYPVGLDILGSRASSLAAVLSERGLKAARESLEAMLSGDPELGRKVRSLLFFQRFSEQMLLVLSAGVSQGSPLWGFCLDRLRSRGLLESTFSDKRKRKQAQKLIEGTATRPEAAGPLSGLADLLAGFSQKNPARRLWSDREVLDWAGRSMLADAGDILAGRVVAEASRRFSRRTGTESDRSLADQYEEGRLYRFGLGGEPFLKSYRRTGEVGHYFIDVKDYTRRTALLKEEVMADFIRREFYDPILAIGQEFYHGLPQLSDRGGLYLNNLLGDAVSFSGDILALVNIARRIRGHLDSYSHSLSRRLDQSDLAGKAAAINQRFEEAKKRLEDWGERGRQAIQRLEVFRDEALGRLTGENLVAGSFIAYGNSPAVVTFEDPVWGRLQVSIAEKINQSARGTERSRSVLASTMALLDHQRKKTGRKDLKLPFRVYVANTMALPLPPEAELALRQAFSQNNPERAVQIYQQVARGHVEGVLAGGPESVENHMVQGMALYNAGDALSGEALAAYRQAREDELEFFDRVVLVGELGSEMVGRYGFSHPELRLVVGLSRFGQEPELFRYAGTLVFKGFERDTPTEIWEMINPEDTLGQLLSRSPAIAFGRQPGF